MKYFEESNRTMQHIYDCAKVITFKDRRDEEDRVLSIIKQDDGEIQFAEQCDDYFIARFSKEEAVELLQEAITWIQK